MIGYSIYTFHKNDEPDPLYGNVTGTLKKGWADIVAKETSIFTVLPVESNAPQQLVLRVEERKVVAGGDPIALAPGNVAEAKEVVACWNAHGAKAR
jgi:hypothetical protein